MIFIAREALRVAFDAAEQAYPGECCGLLVGRVRESGELEIPRAVPARNLGREPGRFEVDPQRWVDLTRALGSGPQRIVGVYHSHPDAPAQPSSIDLDAAWGLELVWLIVSVMGGGDSAPQAVHATFHLLEHGGRQFRELPYRTLDWGPYPTREPAPSYRKEMP